VDALTHWQVEALELTVIYTEHALLDPADRSPSCLLDVWTAVGPKVLSLTWEQERPWQPPQVLRAANGPWRQWLERLMKARTPVGR